MIIFLNVTLASSILLQASSPIYVRVLLSGAHFQLILLKKSRHDTHLLEINLTKYGFTLSPRNEDCTDLMDSVKLESLVKLELT